MLPPIAPQLTPMIRRRLRERFPRLRDEDLPIVELTEHDLVMRIATRSRRKPDRVRQELYAIGALVAPVVATRPLNSPAPDEPSLGSGVPDDTGQSGMMSLGPGW